jgi:hypothetical protein
MNFKFVAILSYGLNVILLIVAGYVHQRLNAVPMPLQLPKIASTSSSETSTIKQSTSTSTLPETQPRTSIWDALYSKDLRQFHGNLRQAGCPEKTMRDIVLPMIDDTYHKKRQGIYRSSTNSFWQSNNRMYADQRKARFALDMEKSALVRELFGVSLDMNALTQWHKQFPMGIALGFLPEGKPEQVLWTAIALTEEAEKIHGLASEILTPEDCMQMEALYAKAKNDFSAILTPYEIEELEARATVAGIAFVFRESLLGLSLSGQEIRSLMCSIIGMGNPFLRNILLAGGRPTKEEEAKLRAILEERLLAAVGKDRFAEYQRLQNPIFRMINLVADKFSVPKTKIDTLYQITQAAKEEETNLRKNPNLTPEQRKQAEAQNAQAVEQTARQLLGDKTYEEMKKTRLP